MQVVSPLGQTYQAGTLSGNPLAMVAGYATLTELETQNAFTKLEDLGKYLDHIMQEKLVNYLETAKFVTLERALFSAFSLARINYRKILLMLKKQI